MPGVVGQRVGGGYRQLAANLRYGLLKRRPQEVGGQTVEGVVIALEDDIRLKRALTMVPNTSFYRYQVSFRLIPG